MDVEILKCNVLEVLQSSDRSILQKWVSSCREFRSYVAAKIEERLQLEADLAKKKSANAEKILELQQEIDAIQSNTDSILLEQKTVERKLSNIIRLQENLSTDIAEAKVQKETLLSEISDLQLKIEKKKERVFFEWNAIKRACNAYKINLDIRIGVEGENDCQNIKFSFFPYNQDEEDTYFVQLLHKQNNWKVERIEPKIKKEHLSELCFITDSSECSKISSITLFLYQIRNIYLKYYMKTKERTIETN